MSERWATFDCYGTLADWVGGMTAAVAPYAGARTPELMDAYYAAELEVEHEQPTARYREILALSLERAAARVGVEVPRDAIGATWGDMPIFDDTRPALQALQADGWKLAILTNCDDALIALTVEKMGIAFEDIVTAEQAGSYKPAPGHWEAFARRHPDVGVHIHVAESYVHDHVATHALGLPSVWIDRRRTGQDDSIVTAHLHALKALPETLARLAASAA